jgi:hypothetical protein
MDHDAPVKRFKRAFEVYAQVLPTVNPIPPPGLSPIVTGSVTGSAISRLSPRIAALFLW